MKILLFAMLLVATYAQAQTTKKDTKEVKEQTVSFDTIKLTAFQESKIMEIEKQKAEIQKSVQALDEKEQLIIDLAIQPADRSKIKEMKYDKGKLIIVLSK